MAPEAENADAIVQAWYGGEKGGEALADVLFGAYNPSGKLPVTFYRSTDQLPDYEDYNMKGRTYRYFEGEPLFPFGYGLSYTSFELGNPTWDAKKGTLSVSVANTGDLDGTQTVMVFVKDPDDADGPIKSLRDFTRVQLKPGEKKDVVFSLDDKAFALWNSNTNTMHAQDKPYTVMVGTSSADPDMKVLNVKHGK
jgi:beta-glucosidase